MMRFTVDRLLEPFSFSQFHDTYYEKQPLLIERVAPTYYAGLLSLEAINAHLGEAGLLSTELRLVRNFEPLDEADCTWPHDSANTRFADDAADKEKVFARFYEGYSIDISSYERHCAAVLHLRHDLERVFHAPVETHVVLTPRNAQGLSAHHDRNDLFILQFEGTKEWTVHDHSGMPVVIATLKPGDFLYVPDGFISKARSADTLNAHIAFALEKYTYADLLRQIADNAEASPWLRRSLAADVRSAAPHDEFLRQVHQFFDDTDLSAYLQRMHSNFATERLPDSSNRLADYVRLPSISATTSFRRRSGAWPDLTNSGDLTVLTFHRKSLQITAAAAESIRFMIDAGEFVASALPGNDDENLALCSMLVREGFLAIV